jgi:hypothetical protein
VFGLKILLMLKSADKKIRYRISNKEFRISKYEIVRAVQALAPRVALF